jgi:hypothetical protein
MPDPVLQNHYCVAALQHRLSYNVTMSLSVNGWGDGPVAAIGPVLRTAGKNLIVAGAVRLGVILLVAIVVAAVLWTRRRSRTGTNGPDQ